MFDAWERGHFDVCVNVYYDWPANTVETPAPYYFLRIEGKTSSHYLKKRRANFNVNLYALSGVM